jgi:hypothetical protein
MHSIIKQAAKWLDYFSTKGGSSTSWWRRSILSGRLAVLPIILESPPVGSYGGGISGA